jgi:hypothetical protein
MGIGNRTHKGSPPIVRLHIRPATPEEARGIEQTIDRVLGELVRQVREPMEVEDVNPVQKEQEGRRR